MTNRIGCTVSLENISNQQLESDEILFSESHSRYLLTFDKKNLQRLEELLKKNNVTFQVIGKFGGDSIRFTDNSKSIIDLSVDKAHKTWISSLKEMVMHA